MSQNPSGQYSIPVSTEQMQELVIRSVKRGTLSVFSTMLNMKAQAGDAYSISGSPISAEGVVSLVGLAGPWMGTGSLSCNSKLARMIAQALLLENCPAVDDQVLDAIGEITNIVVGNVKTDIEEIVGSMGLSIPTVIYGRNFSTRSAGGNWIVVPFQCGPETLLVQICLVKHKENGTGCRAGFTHPHVSDSLRLAHN